MAQERGIGTDWKEYAKAMDKAERELSIIPYVTVSICKKVNGKEIVLYRYDLPRESMYRWQWVIDWRKAKFICEDPRSYIYTTIFYYDKTSGKKYGFGTDLSRLVALKSKITLQENRIKEYIKANQDNMFFDEATDPQLNKIRAKVELAKERVAQAESELKEKVEMYKLNKL